MIPTILIISFLTFLIIQAPPGDYLSNQISELRSQGDTAALDQIEFLRHEYSLDRPFVEQYGVWIGILEGPNGFSGLLQGNLGHSFEFDRPVSEVVSGNIAFTVLLNFSVVLFTWIMAFPIGVYSATHQYSWGDHTLSFVGFLGLATPNFLLALIIMYFANVHFGTSIGGLMAPEYINQPWSWDKLLSVLEHLWIPVVIIGTSGTAGMIRRLRANLLDELQKQYVVTGRAKGLPATRLLIKYPLRVSLNPFIADIGNLLPTLISGSALIAMILSLPTLGPLLVQALRSQDQYLAGALIFMLTLLTVVGMFISDIALSVLDPRIRLGGKRLK
tara:strand:- start:966 stop:1958 length:993 start_codon:yes stop_codon:yes gene_type:complete